MENENNSNKNSPLILLEHIRKVVERIFDELKDINGRLQSLENITEIDCREIVIEELEEGGE